MPAQPLDADTVLGLVAEAIAAPSLHNAQPWRFRFLPGSQTFELRADLLRTLERTDPDNRAMHLGCGAALFNLRVAAAHAGRHPQARLLPHAVAAAAADPGDELETPLLATLRLSELSGPDDRELAALHPAIARRRTSREPFEEREIPAELRTALADAARREGAQLALLTPWHTEALLDLVRDAEGREARDPERAAELARWTRSGDSDLDPPFADEGIPSYAFGPRKHGGHAPVRDFAGRRRPVPGRAAAVFEERPQLALLGTQEDRPQDWLRAGQALERVLLLATGHGLATALSSQAMESADLRRLARDPQSPMARVQMVLRLGYGPSGPATPRRPARDVLDFD
ncbi:nitroreductase family protein [Streptomyces sp. N2-109]|uniref:Nitroreductase family protein n=1 Tax=Streptomyces gossypii TaxID=2883101 RepID=A0ABT2K2V4_9ACTN|nr:nitroreductase family protein [Streptomyces gossypii]MCT2594421.1 nitroreductase family protein [Streptomyces gossypii]